MSGTKRTMDSMVRSMASKCLFQKAMRASASVGRCPHVTRWRVFAWCRPGSDLHAGELVQAADGFGIQPQPACELAQIGHFGLGVDVDG